MIYLLTRQKYFVRWLPGYMKNLARGFEELGEKVEFIDVERFAQKEFPVKNTDVVIVVDYDDLPTVIDIKNRLGEKCPILVSHSHGSSAFFMASNETGFRLKERYELGHMDLVACNTEWHTDVMYKEFRVGAFYAGYPMDFEGIAKFGEGVEKDPRKIVVGGRIEIDRQLLLAVECLEPLVGEYDIVFCCPHSREQAVYTWGGDTITKFEERMHFLWDCWQERFYKELASASVVTTFGIVDTLNLSIIEGAVLGAYPLVPHKMPYLEYVSEGFAPYCYKDIRHRIRTRPPLKLSYEKYDYKLVAERYLKAIRREQRLRGEN